MTILTSIASMAKKSVSQTTATETQVNESNVVNIRSARKAQMKAQQELLDYMMWTMKHDMDPHRVYDDPIEIFRAEMKATLSVA